MNAIDWSIIVAYLFGMIGLSIYLGRGQTSQEDYYVGGRKIHWSAIGISTMATQTSAISFISIPAFVALKENGGLAWLTYELAVPLSMIVVMIFLLPFFRKLQLVSVYEYLELRFSPEVRYLVSMVFLISRALATGVGLYASAIVLSVGLGIPIMVTILIIGLVTIIYDTIGGISAVIYSDVIQMIILLSGVIICIIYAMQSVGGFGEVFAAFPSERLTTLDLSMGFDSSSPIPFWAFLFGGFFLYISYYGTDQSQVQRELSAASIDETKKSLLFNGVVRFPLTILYVLMGIAIFAVYQTSPDLQAVMTNKRPDYLVPQYILLNLPVGLRAILFASLLAAAMSSLDSALNSLSAATIRDFVNRIYEPASQKLYIGKLITVMWGIIITGFAFFVGSISGTVIEAINKIGSAFYGPILAAFLVGVLSKRINAFGIFSGIAAGVVLNISLWLFAPQINWMWWNVFGTMTTVVFAFILSCFQIKPTDNVLTEFTLERNQIYKHEKKWLPYYAVLVLYFLIILMVMLFIQLYIS